MALLGLGGLPLGFAGLQTGLQFATGQNNLLDARNAIGNDLANQFEQNVRVQGLSQGRTSPEIQASLGLLSPFRNQANANLQSAIGAQRALAPQAFAQANTGNFNPINRLLGLFGDVGNVGQNNFNSVDLLGLLGGQGIGAAESLRRSDPLDALQRQSFELQIQRQQQLLDEQRQNTGGNSFGFGFAQGPTSTGFNPVINL